jgi:AGCS family alanine or glycine:cation symporter
MQLLDRFFAVTVDYAWGWPLIVLLIGGGAYLTLLTRFLPFRGLRHAYDILRGKFDDPNDPGEISHFEALSTALSATVGMGNIAGVAIAITQGGPGAVFWMWIAAVVGMATKFFTCTLACMYRKEDEDGVSQGGPMYYIEVGLGPKYRFLAVLFSVFGLVGCLAMFQANQLAEVLNASHGLPHKWTGLLGAAIVAVVIFGGISRIGKVAARLVPAMCVLYVGACLWVIAAHASAIPGVFVQIFSDAFTGTAATGGAVGIAVSKIIAVGVKRAAFSNEAGIGTAPMAHGAAKTKEPVREGLVAMVGPFIDTIVVCTMTACVILTTGVWRGGEVKGVALTAQAFESVMGSSGRILVTVAVVLFALSTMFGYAYYGRKCFIYLFGKARGRLYDGFYVLSMGLGAVWSLDVVINMLDTGFAMMTLPNMIATLLLAPKVMDATRDYFKRMQL